MDRDSTRLRRETRAERVEDTELESTGGRTDGRVVNRR